MNISSRLRAFTFIGVAMFSLSATLAAGRVAEECDGCAWPEVDCSECPDGHCDEWPVVEVQLRARDAKKAFKGTTIIHEARFDQDRFRICLPLRFHRAHLPDALAWARDVQVRDSEDKSVPRTVRPVAIKHKDLAAKFYDFLIVVDEPKSGDGKLTLRYELPSGGWDPHYLILPSKLPQKSPTESHVALKISAFNHGGASWPEGVRLILQDSTGKKIYVPRNPTTKQYPTAKQRVPVSADQSTNLLIETVPITFSNVFKIDAQTIGEEPAAVANEITINNWPGRYYLKGDVKIERQGDPKVRTIAGIKFPKPSNNPKATNVAGKFTDDLVRVAKSQTELNVRHLERVCDAIAYYRARFKVDYKVAVGQGGTTVKLSRPCPLGATCDTELTQVVEGTAVTLIATNRQLTPVELIYAPPYAATKVADLENSLKAFREQMDRFEASTADKNCDLSEAAKLIKESAKSLETKLPGLRKDELTAEQQLHSVAQTEDTTCCDFASASEQLDRALGTLHDEFLKKKAEQTALLLEHETAMRVLTRPSSPCHSATELAAAP